jgi:uncharacterized protein (DUF433 family)
MTKNPHITFRSSPMGVRAALTGTRLDVSQVVETIRDSGNSVEEAACYLGLSEAKVAACLQYYAEHTDEIDAWIERAHEIVECEERTWRRQQ